MKCGMPTYLAEPLDEPLLQGSEQTAALITVSTSQIGIDSGWRRPRADVLDEAWREQHQAAHQSRE